MKGGISIPKIIIIAAVIIVVIAAAVFGICWCLAMQDNISDKYTLSEEDDGITMTAIRGSIFGKDFEIDETQINTFINKKLCKESTGDNTGIDHIRLYFYDDRPTEIYAHAFRGGTKFAAHCKANFDVDPDSNEVMMKLYDAYIGELHIPDNILNNILESILEGNEKVKYISNAGRNVSFTAKYTIDIKNTSGLTIGLKEATAGNAVLMCRTNSLSGQALKAAVEYIGSEDGRETISGMLGNVKDKISGWLSGDDDE